MPHPKVSIIVPVYNVEKYINRCIDSILSQTFTNFECILVDDHTPDSSGAICDGYAEKDNRIKVIHKAQNEGLPQARKTGFENSSGDYIVNIDSDDHIEVDMIEKMYNMAISEDFDMVYCDLYRYDRHNNAPYEKMPVLSNNYIENIKSAILGFNAGCAVINKLIKRETYEKVKFPKYSNGEDKNTSAQILFFSSKIGYVNAALYHYRYNPLSLVNNPKLELKRYLERRNNFTDIFNFLKERHGEDLSAFEPELTRRQNWLKEKNPRSSKNIAKKILRFMLPIKIFVQFKKLYYKIRG
jgi:glycosyltransferase involved in cell wall biosynthesis